MLRRSLTLAASWTLALTPLAVATACPDWNAFGDDDDDDDDGNEGEGEGEGEGEAAEGEGEGGEGEGEGEGEPGLDGPRWDVVDAPVAARAELANAGTRRLAAFDGRLFAVGVDHVFEVIDDGDGEALDTVATLEVPCNDVELTGAVAVDGTDILVGTSGGAVRFHADGSCEPQYAVSLTGSPSAVAPLAGGALVYDGQQLALVDDAGETIDTHAFEDFTEGDFYVEDADAVLLVRRFSNGPGQVVRVTVPASELIITPVFDAALVLAGGQPVTLRTNDRFGARFVDVIVDEASAAPATAELRVAPSDDIIAFAADEGGEVAIVGDSALVAFAQTADAAFDVTSATGTRFGGLERVVASPSGELWAAGPAALLYWSAADAALQAAPTIVEVDEQIDAQGPLRAIDGSLFFAGTGNELKRADVDGAALDIVTLVDSVSFEPVFVDGSARMAFLPEGDGAPPRLVAATRSQILSYELTDDLGAVTATLTANVSASFFDSVRGLTILDDASKAAFIVGSSTFFTCALELPAGLAPVATCDSGRSTGVSVSFNGKITVLDPSPGVDDETFVIAGSGGVGIVEPGESGRFVGVDTDASAPALLVEGCVLGFSSSQGSWSALNQDQPQAPAGRRGFEATDALVLDGRVVVVGPATGEAGQIAHFPAPSSSTCADAEGAPVLEGTAMFGGERRSQVELTSAAFRAGELYVLDADGLLWHVPTP